MKKGTKIAFTIFLFLISAVVKVSAQTTYFTNQEISLQVNFVPGNSYNWGVYLDKNGLSPADASAFEFLSSQDSNEIRIQFSQPGNYYMIVFESNEFGCSTGRSTNLSILANNQTLAFTNLSSTQCYQTEDNSFSVGLQLADHNGNPVTQDHFPVAVNYQVNGFSQPTQTISFSNQNLEINSSSFAVDSTQNTSVAVTLLSATDTQNLTIQPLVGQDIHSHTILAQPQIAFSQPTDTVYQNAQLSYSVDGDSNWTYDWILTNPSGGETTLASTNSQSDQVSFTQLGTYQLRVQATNGQSCISDSAIKKIVVIANPAIQPLAVQDINMTWKNSVVSGNVFTNDLLFGASQVSISLVKIPMATAGRLTNFDTKTGDYTFEPATDFTGEAIFQYQLCTTKNDGSSVCGDTASVTIQIIDPNEASPTPVANDDVFLTMMDQPISGNFLDNDFNPGNGNFSISRVVTTDLPGTLNWKPDGTFSYTPPANYTGNVHFNYQLCDPTGNCDWATAAIYIPSPDNTVDQLHAADDAFYTEGVLNGQLAINDYTAGNTTVLYQANPVKAPARGTVNIQPDGQFVYSPTPDSYGAFADQFVYEVCDGDSVCSQATAYIVANVTRPTIVANSSHETGECAPIQLDASKSSGFGQLSYQWEPADYLDNPTSSMPIFSPRKSTNYTLTVTDENGNSTSRNIAVTVHDAPQVVTNNQVFVINATDVVMLDA
ncbi:MAG TPA: Ig-like domain-containing protein, partial [Sunxiuqinia sp.]|nr:Ig-like domain-containing protein [Sunxiuqinia sp.]